VSTTNRRVELVPYVRTRADGGNARNWVFCMNQLGGVGRRWGQAAGPGNRGGVHEPCQALADVSRRRYPRQPKQSTGYGGPWVFRSNHRVLGQAQATAPMNIWALAIGTNNYNGPTLLVHPYYFYQGLDSPNQIGLHCAPGTQFNSSASSQVTVVGNNMALNMEINSCVPQDQTTPIQVAPMRFPYDGSFPSDGSELNQSSSPYTKLWRSHKGYTGLNGNSPYTFEGAGGLPGSLNLKTGEDLGGMGSAYWFGKDSGPTVWIPGPNPEVPFRGFSYEGRVWKLWAGDVLDDVLWSRLQYGSPSSFITTVTDPTNTFNPTQSCPPAQGLDCCNTTVGAGQVNLWGSIEGGSGEWAAMADSQMRNDFPRYLSNVTSQCYVNTLPYGAKTDLQAQQLPGALQISGTLVCDRMLGVMYAKTGEGGQAPIEPDDVGWVGYSFQCVDGRTVNGKEKFPVKSLPHAGQVTRGPSAPPPAGTPDPDDQAPIASFAATPGTTGADNSEIFTFTATGTNAPVVAGGFINMPTDLEYNEAEDQFNAIGDIGHTAPTGPTAVDVKIEVKNSLLVTLYPGYVPLALWSSQEEIEDELPPSCTIVSPSGNEPPTGVQRITLAAPGGNTRTVYYQYVRFMNQPAFRSLWDEAYASTHNVDWAVNGRGAPVSADEACQWQNIVQNQIHKYVKDNNGEWPPGWQGRPSE